MTFLQAALAAQGEPTQDPSRLRLLCICEVEYCYCLETAELDPAVVAAAEADARAAYTCLPCQAGHHVDMDGTRR